MTKLSLFSCYSQILDPFFWRNFLQRTSKFLTFSRNHIKDINTFFHSLCHMHCWLSRTSYRTQISLFDLEKQSFLRPLVRKNWHNFQVFRPLQWVILNGKKCLVWKGLKGRVKITFLPVIALSFPLFCLKLEQSLHKHQEQHSWHAGNIYIFFEKGPSKYLKMSLYVESRFRWIVKPKLIWP